MVCGSHLKVVRNVNEYNVDNTLFIDVTLSICTTTFVGHLFKLGVGDQVINIKLLMYVYVCQGCCK